MNPTTATDAEVSYWTERDGDPTVARRVLGGPEEGDDVIPCPTLIAFDKGQCHVAYKLNEIELAALAQGGTLWLTTWGMLPVHLLEVVDPGPDR